MGRSPLGKGAVLSREQRLILGMPVELVRKRISRMYLRLAPGGSLKLSAPATATDARIESFIQSQLDWIQKQRQQAQHNQARLAMSLRDHIGPGGVVSVFGTRYTPAQVLDGAGLSARAARAALHGLSADAVAGLEGQDRACVNAALREALRVLTAQAATPLVQIWKTKMCVEPRRLSIRDSISRWGSCNTRTHDINLSLWLGHYPVACLQEVIVHELAHLLERSHNARFYAIMDRYLPDWRVHRQILRGPSFDGGDPLPDQES